MSRDSSSTGFVPAIPTTKTRQGSSNVRSTEMPLAATAPARWLGCGWKTFHNRSHGPGISRRERPGPCAELGAFALSPVAFVWGLLGPHRPLFLLRQIVFDSIGVGTHVFSLVGCMLIAGTAAYFIFERLPKPELLDPLLLPEMMIVTGHTLVRVILPLGPAA